MTYMMIDPTGSLTGILTDAQISELTRRGRDALAHASDLVAGMQCECSLIDRRAIQLAVTQRMGLTN